jgi:two-component system cell cycle sensor histidine kinase/response regulator CckA
MPGALPHNPSAIPTIATAVATAVLGLSVLVRERGSRVGFAFAQVTWLVALWLAALSSLYLTDDPATAVWRARSLYVSVPFIPVAIYRFSVLMMRIDERRRAWIRVLFLIAAAFSVGMVATGRFVSAQRQAWGFYPRFLPPTAVFLAFFFAVMLATFAEYNAAIRRQPEGRTRDRLRALRLAFVIGYLGCVDYLPAYGVPVRAVGFLPVCAFLAFSGLVIWRYRLVDLTPSFAAPQIVATMADPLVVCDTDGIVRVVNKATLDVLGWRHDDLVGGTVDRLCPDDPPAERLSAILLRAPLRHHQMRVSARDHRRVEVSVSISPLEESGVAAGWVLVLHDLTDLKTAQAALAESEAKYRELFENAQDVVYTHDLAGRFTSLNAAGERLLGWPREQAIELRLSDVVAKEHLARAREMLRRKLDGEPVTTYELDVVTRDGRRLTLEISTRLLQDDGRPVGVHGIARDVTDRRRAEEALRASEERYRLLFEGNLAGVSRSTLDGRRLDCNLAFARMFGYATVAEYLADPADAMYADAADRALLIERLQEAGQIMNFENTLRRRDGARVDVLVNLTLRHESGVGPVIEGIAIDVTARKKLEEELRHAQKMEAIGQLSGAIAHDFNNLVSVILGYGQIALQKAGADSALAPDLEHIKRAGERAARLTRQLLAFSRKQVLQPEVLDLRAVVTQMEPMLRPLLGERVELRTLLAAQPVLAKADQGQLDQVLMNLVVNARDAMADGGTVTVSAGPWGDASSGGRFSALTVTDTGTGMDEATRARIFEPFFTTKERGQGTGLGLATVYGIVTQSGGQIEVDSAPGGGTTFRILLKEC